MNISSISSSVSSMVSSSASSTKSSDQIELLQRQKATLQKQLENTDDENVKKQLQLQIQSIEQQILEKQEEEQKSQGQGAGSGQKPSGPPQGGKSPTGAAGAKNKAGGNGIDVTV